MKACGLLLLLTCVGLCGDRLPPMPIVKPVLLSPKDAANRSGKTMVKAAALVVVVAGPKLHQCSYTNHGTMMQTAFIQRTLSLKPPAVWSNMQSVVFTNYFVTYVTNDMAAGFYRVCLP